ncbi:MAG: class I tRNA ligase family protein, partial [Bacilli bacterium]|nr:class I tRNA ligase family protein [Bacilli bacterium]
PLIYYSKPSFYLEVTKFKDKIIENNNKVNWYPSYVGEKRFGNWLENLNDWAISRNRYWGTPLPLWRCNCGHQEMIGSRAELIERAQESIDMTIDLHRPYVDNIHLTCPKCGSSMNRVTDVIDCWFDSGSMPFAQYHYPFENEDLFESQFPADYICEGIDQTRGWFYTLIVISTFVKGVSPYKNVLVNDLLLDAEGKKMSKSKGNIVEPFSTMKEYGADTVRFYLPYVSPVWTPLKFDMNGLKEVYSKFFNPLRNTYNFFTMYANTDNIDIDKCKIEVEKREEIDRWLISKYHKLLKYVTESYEEYDLNKVVRALTDFVSDDLSNWYIRRNRNRFWGNTLDNSKKAVYITTYEVLVGLAQIMAPIVPYLSDEIYTNLTGEYSVHTSDFPKYEEKYFDEVLEEKMDLVRDLIRIGRNSREENKIRVRQPLGEILIDGKNEDVLGNLTELIMEELNVKKVTFVTDTREYMNYTVKPNFKNVGKTFGSNMKEFQAKLLELSDTEIQTIQNGGTVKMAIADTDYDIDITMIDIRIDAKEGFNVGMENNHYVILNTHLTEELINEGIAREFVSKVQQIRKNKDFEVADRITIKYKADEEISKAITAFSDYIQNETLAVEIEQNDTQEEKIDINEHEVYVSINKKN